MVSLPRILEENETIPDVLLTTGREFITWCYLVISTYFERTDNDQMPHGGGFLHVSAFIISGTHPLL